jgi:CheY-like chemotaxis protein
MAKNAKNKRVLIIEDDLEVRNSIVAILKSYGSLLSIDETSDTGEAWPFLFPEDPDHRPDALVLDLMMPYGDAGDTLGAQEDPSMIRTGVELLNYLRESENQLEDNQNLHSLWVSVITARSNPSLIQEVSRLLGQFGRIYLKPFNDFEFENDLASVLGIESKVIYGLLADDYKPPILWEKT